MRIYHYITLATLLVLLPTSMKATHLMGADISYTCLGNNQYEVTLKVYRDCNGIALGGYQVTYNSSTCGSGTQLLNYVSSQEITPSCPAQTTTSCDGGSGIYGVEEYIFQAMVTLPQGCSDVTLSWERCCRNYAITTLSSPGSESMYVETTILDASFCNNSPVFLNPPVPFVCVGQPVFYNHGATDPDGDDLRFSLTDCMDNASNAVGYANGYDANNPLSTTNGLSIDSLTGAISFTSSTQEVGVLCVLVEEYRNGIKIGEIVRDIQFTTLNCMNDSPTLTGIDSSNNFSVNVKVGESVCFDVFSNDVNAFQTLQMNWNQAIANAQFTINNNTTFPKGNFCWTPTMSAIGNNAFTVTISDDNCPLVGMNTYTFNINVSIDTVQSIANGTASNSNTWDCNCIPTANQHIIINDTVTFNTNFSMTNGTNLVINNGAVLQIANNQQLTIEGDLNNYGSIEGEGVLALNGSMAKVVRLGTVNKVEATNLEGVLMAADVLIKEKLILTQGYFNANGYEVVLYSDTNSTALIQDNGGEYIGDVICQRRIHSTIGYHYLSSPVNDATVNELDDDFALTLNGNAPHIYFYDETNPSADKETGWIVPTSLQDPMFVGVGYAAYFIADSGITIDVKGQPNSGTIDVLLTHTATNPPSTLVDTTNCPPEGWNLIGNPYPSPISLDRLMEQAPAAVKQAYYVWNPTTKRYDSRVDGISVSGKLTGNISAMQAFWVKTDANTTLTFDNSVRLSNPSEGNHVFEAANNAAPIMRLQLDGQGGKENTVIRFKSNATNGFDGAMDAHFLIGGGANPLEFASLTSSGPLSINTLPLYQSNSVTIPLLFSVVANGSYTIRLPKFDGFQPNDQLLLHDALTGQTHVLNSSDYTFTANTTDSPRRFTLELVPAFITNTQQLSTETQDQWKAYRSGNNLMVSFEEPLTENQELQLFNALGQRLYTKELIAGNRSYTLSDLTVPNNNVYILRLGNKDKAQKIMW